MILTFFFMLCFRFFFNLTTYRLNAFSWWQHSLKWTFIVNQCLWSGEIGAALKTEVYWVKSKKSKVTVSCRRPGITMMLHLHPVTLPSLNTPSWRLTVWQRCGFTSSLRWRRSRLSFTLSFFSLIKRQILIFVFFRMKEPLFPLTGL